MGYSLRAGQAVGSRSTSSAVLPTLTLPQAPIAGNVLGFIAGANTASATGLPVPTSGAGWVKLVGRISSQTRQIAIFWKVVQAGDSATFNYTANAGSQIDGHLAEFTVTGGGTPTADQVSSGVDLTTNTTSTGAITVPATQGTDDFVVAGVYTSTNVTAGSETTGLSMLVTTGRLLSAYQALTGTFQIVAPNFTWTTSANVVATAGTISAAAIVAGGGWGAIPV